MVPSMTLGYLALERRCFLSACLTLIRKEEGWAHSRVVKTEAGRVEQPVISPQLSKDSATGFTISCIREWISPFLS